jgi:hypothetical protein
LRQCFTSGKVRFRFVVFGLSPFVSSSDKPLSEKGSIRDGDAPEKRFARVFCRRPRALPAADSGVDAGGSRANRRGALYASRVSEHAPQVVYSASLEEVEDESQGSLQININTADVDEVDELPEVGPATAESLIEYRRTNGMFRSVEEECGICGLTFTLESVVAQATTDRNYMGQACPECVAFLGGRNPGAFPTLEEYRSAVARYPFPMYGSEEAIMAAEDDGTFEEAYASSWIIPSSR